MPAAAIARIVAPLALLAVLVALAVVVGGGGSGPTAPTASTVTEATRTTGRRSYRVRSGDALSEIAERYDLSVAQLVELNPDIDPQALQTGQRLRLRR